MIFCVIAHHYERLKNSGVSMKAMLIECPHSNDDKKDKGFHEHEERSNEGDVCQDKILVKIHMETSKKVFVTYTNNFVSLYFKLIFFSCRRAKVGKGRRKIFNH